MEDDYQDDPVINTGELSRVVRAFLSNPNRHAKGATEQEIITVINWARELKLRAAINITLLRKIYTGGFYLDLKEDDEVVMSLREDYVEPYDPEVEEWLEM